MSSKTKIFSKVWTVKNPAKNDDQAFEKVSRKFLEQKV